MIITNITKSYSYKINHALYGGHQYESSDHFCSLTAEVDESDDLMQCSRDLSLACEDIVFGSVETQIASFQGGIPAKEFDTFMYDYVAGRVLNPEVFDETRKRLSPSQAKTIDIIRRAKATKKRDNKHD